MHGCSSRGGFGLLCSAPIGPTQTMMLAAMAAALWLLRRGCTCLEQSVLGGVAHLLNFDGTGEPSAEGWWGWGGVSGGRNEQGQLSTQHLLSFDGTGG